MTQPDWIRVLEEAYEYERPVDAWLSALASAARGWIPKTVALGAYTYDASSPERFTIEDGGFDPSDEPWRGAFERFRAVPVPPAYVVATYLSRRAGSTVETLGQGAPLESAAQFRAITGFGDVLAVNGVDADGQGLVLTVCRGEYLPFTDAERVSLERVAAHLSAGWRLRRRLARAEAAPIDRAEAVLTPDGALAHAVDHAAEAPHREALSLAVRAIDHARTRAQRSDPTRGLTEWRGMVARRWSLMEVFERDGKRFLLAQENRVPKNRRVSLTAREHEVAALAALGLSNKLIAYELGVTAATVGVLLHRARKKLRARGADDLRDALLAARTPRDA